MSWASRRRFYGQLRELGFRDYNEYLQSAHWRDLKARYMASKLFNGACFACGQRPKFFHAHHRTYKRLGREWLMDIVLVCPECHQAAHQLEGSSSRVNLWNSIKRVRALHAGGRKRLSGAHRPLAGTVRAGGRSRDREHVS